MKIKKSTKLYIMIALISALSSLSTACVFEYLRTPPTAAYALESHDLNPILQILRNIDSTVSSIYKMM